MKLIGKLLCDSGFECDGEVVAILVPRVIWLGELPPSIQEKRVLEDLLVNQGHSLLFLHLLNSS